MRRITEVIILVILLSLFVSSMCVSQEKWRRGKGKRVRQDRTERAGKRQRIPSEFFTAVPSHRV